MYLYPLSQFTRTNIQTFHVSASYSPFCFGRIKVSLLSFLGPLFLCKYSRSVRMSPNTGKAISQLNRAHFPSLAPSEGTTIKQNPHGLLLHYPTRLVANRELTPSADANLMQSASFLFLQQPPNQVFPDCLQTSIGCNDWGRKFHSVPRHV